MSKIMKLKDYLKKAADAEYALGHFNFSDSVVLSAIADACVALKVPIFVGTSEGEAGFLGYRKAVHLRDALREETGLPVFLNADHHKTFASAKEAIDAGYDSVQIDGTNLSLEENFAVSAEVVKYARKKNRDISVEGELGYIFGSSELLKEKIKLRKEDFTSPDLAREFVEKTGVDRLAVVIGNIHGISIAGNPRLDIPRLAEIHSAIPDVPLTLHGGSGIDERDIKATLAQGMSNIHINTELRLAFSAALRLVLAENEETTPYKYFGAPRRAVQKVVEDKLRLFGAQNTV